MSGGVSLTVAEWFRLRKYLLMRLYSVLRGRELRDAILTAETEGDLLQLTDLYSLLQLPKAPADSPSRMHSLMAALTDVIGITRLGLIVFLETGSLKPHLQPASTTHVPEGAPLIGPSSSLSPMRAEFEEGVRTVTVTDSDSEADPQDAGAYVVTAAVEEPSVTPCSAPAPHSLAMVRSTSNLNLNLNNDANTAQAKRLPFWRKVEKVVHERSVQYTTVDDAGKIQELTESEVTRTEVLHMECKETGELAHRELTTYTQSEVFNGDGVLESQGYEEYVHLRSLEDEVEFVNSDGAVPGQQQQQQDQGQDHQSEGSPRTRSPRYEYGTTAPSTSPRSSRHKEPPEFGSRSPLSPGADPFKQTFRTQQSTPFGEEEEPVAEAEASHGLD